MLVQNQVSNIKVGNGKLPRIIRKVKTLTTGSQTERPYSQIATNPRPN